MPSPRGHVFRPHPTKLNYVFCVQCSAVMSLDYAEPGFVGSVVCPDNHNEGK